MLTSDEEKLKDEEEEVERLRQIELERLDEKDFEEEEGVEDLILEKVLSKKNDGDIKSDKESEWS